MKLLNRSLPLTIIFLTISNLVGCATKPQPLPERVVYISVPLEKPAKPEIRRIPGRDMACLSEDTKLLLLNRDAVMKDYIHELETVIDSTHSK